MRSNFLTVLSGCDDLPTKERLHEQLNTIIIVNYFAAAVAVSARLSKHSAGLNFGCLFSAC